MRALHNVEKSGLRAGEYVGYCHGAWRIKRMRGGWRAVSPCGRWSIPASTLAEISRDLDTRAAQAA